MEPTTPTVAVANNKSKMAIIVIIVLIIIAGAIAVISRRGKTEVNPANNGEVQNGTVSESDDSQILTQEITAATTFDNEKDLSEIDSAF